MDEKVQLSRETIVGDDVVNEDIYPNTNTKSVNDEQSGTALNETIERIWAAINNKLSRNVNSVNGRSGIVVLDSSDVGLDNVDNVSFNDIKSWVLDELSKVFDYKKIKLFETKSELDACITENDLNNAFAPFYVERWNETDDTRPHIGCIILDPNDNQRLNYQHRPISGVGATDDSLTYQNTIGTSSDPAAGTIRVKISSDEDALYVETNSELTEEQRGLKIDKNSIGGVFHFYDGVYGDPIPDPDHPGRYIYLHGLLSTDLNGVHPMCAITIDGHLFDDTYPLADESIHQDDTIVCNFRDYRSDDANKMVLRSDFMYLEIQPSLPDPWEHSGDGYRVGDILDLDRDGVVAKFIVTGIKDGKKEGPVASLNLLYCEPVETVGIVSGYYLTKPIIRSMVPGDVGYPDPVDPVAAGFPVPEGSVLENSYVSIVGTTTASGCYVYIDNETSWVRSQYNIPDGMDFKFMMRGMCIGCVRSAPTRTAPNRPYRIEFNSIRPLIGNSLQFKTYDTQFHSDKFSQVVDIRTRKGHFNVNGLWNQTLDVSGIGVAENWGEYREDGKPARIVEGSDDTLVEPNRMQRVAVLPGGVADVMPNSQSSTGGIAVMTDMSLCIIPHDICAPRTDGERTYNCTSQYSSNWSAAVPYMYPTYQKDTPSYVGVNIFKVVKPKNISRSVDPTTDIFLDRKYLFNMSGLRIVNRWETIDKSMMGKSESDVYIDNENGSIVESDIEDYPTSGGLMVNVGPGLEIQGSYDNNETPADGVDTFNDSGKVAVRVDNSTVEINSDNRLTVKSGRGFIVYPPATTETPNPDQHLELNLDPTLTYTESIPPAIGVNINKTLYHDIDYMSNRHPVFNLLTSKTPVGEDVGLSVYIDTKFGLGLTISGNDADNGSAPNALMIRTRAADTGSAASVYRGQLSALPNDGLMFDADGRLIAPIDTARGLDNTYALKAVSSDSRGNVTTREIGGIGIKAGPGLTFTDDGALTLAGDYEIKALRSGFDLNNLVTGNYYAKADVSDTISNRPASSLGVFRIEHKPVVPDEGYYIQKLYSFEKKGLIYMRYKTGSAWTAWYHIDGSIVD